MGRSATSTPKAIVILQWENSPATSSPCLRFWMLDCESGGKNPIMSLPTLVEDRIDETSPASFGITCRQSLARLPPLMIYDGSSSSILMHNLTIGDNVDVEYIRWGPGIHFTQMQAKEALFHGAPKALGGGDLLPVCGISCGRGFGSEMNSFGESGTLLTVMPWDNGDGTVDIKYRTRRMFADSLPTVEEAYQSYEQTVRPVIIPAASQPIAWPTVPSNVPVHICTFGTVMEYLVFVSLGQNDEKTQTLITLHTMEKRTALMEAYSMKDHNEDRGLRWQRQTFTLPAGVTNIAPLNIGIYPAKYLFVFYFREGTLRHARMRYAGSGFFDEFVCDLPCFIESTWRSVKPVLAGPEGCQPYAVTASGFVCLFFEGEDGCARYIRHAVPKEVDGLKDGWVVSSWSTGPLLKPAAVGERVSRHFIPVVVPKSYVEMH